MRILPVIFMLLWGVRTCVLSHLHWKYAKILKYMKILGLAQSIVRESEFEIVIMIVSKVGDRSRGRPEGSIFNSYYTDV